MGASTEILIYQNEFQYGFHSRSNTSHILPTTLSLTEFYKIKTPGLGMLFVIAALYIGKPGFETWLRGSSQLRVNVGSCEIQVPKPSSALSPLLLFPSLPPLSLTLRQELEQS